MTLFELTKAEFEKARPLFAGLTFSVNVSAALDGTNTGRLWVDDAALPRSAFMLTGEGGFLGGSPDNAAFNAALVDLIGTRIFAGETIREDEDEFCVRFAPDTWEDAMTSIGKAIDRPSTIWPRLHYVCREVTHDWQNHIPEGFDLCFIDADLVEAAQVENPPDDFVAYALDEMNGNWGAVADFLARGFGFAMMHGETVVCWCIADCFSGAVCEIGIHTRPEYRRRGLAAVTSAATADWCLANGFDEVGWHCSVHNAGSIATAERVGFIKERDYVDYVHGVEKELHIALQGYRAFLDGDYAGCLAFYEDVFTLNADCPFTYYTQAARAAALSGCVDAAYGYLDRAVERGETRIDTIMTSDEFKALHGSAQWEAILDGIRQKKANKHDNG